MREKLTDMIANGLEMKKITKETTKMILWILTLYNWMDDGISPRDKHTGRLFNYRKHCWIIIQTIPGLAQV